MNETLKKSKEIRDIGIINGKYLLYHEKSKYDFYLGELEYNYLRILDDKTNEKEILEKFPTMDRSKIKVLNKILCDKGLIAGYEKKRKINILNVVIFSLRCKNLKSFSGLLKSIIEITFWVLIFLFFFCFFFLYKSINVNGVMKWIMDISIKKSVLILIMMFISVYLHEIGHASMAKAKGLFVVQYDFGFMTFIPCVSTVIVGLSSVKSKWGKVEICLSGISVNLGICSISLICNMLYQAWIMQFLVLFNLIVALFNLMIFTKTDGWQVIKIITDIDENKSKQCRQNNFWANITFDAIIHILRVFEIVSIYYILN